MQKIFIIEDNRDLRLNLVEYLESKGYETDYTDDGLKALALLGLGSYDLIVLDIMLPGLDGFTLLEKLRARGDNTPVLILSARDGVSDRIEGFKKGADDYILKPFSLAELHLRIQAILRRYIGKTKKLIELFGVSMDLEAMTVTRDGKPIKLNPKMFKILKILMLKSPAVVSRKEIELEVWEGHPPDSDSLRTHIHALRNVLDAPFEKPLIRTVTGFGWVVKND